MEDTINEQDLQDWFEGEKKYLMNYTGLSWYELTNLSYAVKVVLMNEVLEERERREEEFDLILLKEKETEQTKRGRNESSRKEQHQKILELMGDQHFYHPK
jgi:hypothetical protein